jgi:hypothetical protein
MLLEQDAAMGGGALLDPRWRAWRATQVAALAGLANVQCLARCCVVGAYGHGVYAALETLDPAESARFHGLRERLRVIRARRLLLSTGATGAHCLSGQCASRRDAAGAALVYLCCYGVAVGGSTGVLPTPDEATRPRLNSARPASPVPA